MIFQSFKMAKAIAGNKMRSFLTILGVVIGVLAIVVLVAIGQGANSSVTASIEGMGTNLISATINARRMNPVTADGLYELAENEAIAYIAPLTSASGTVKAGSNTYDDGVVQGPYISSCGMSLSITGGHCYRQSMECDGADAVRRAVRIQVNKGADVIKFMGSGGLEHFPHEDPSIPQFTLEELTAGAEAAHDLGRACAIHAYSNEGIRRAVFAGIDNIEHGCMKTEDLIEEMARRGTHLNPTMTGIRGAAKAGPNAKYWDMLQERVFSKQEQGMRWAKQAGILIGAGTDTAGTLRDEIAMIGETLGEGPVEALGHALGVNAQIAGRSDMGLLEVGRLANFAAFDGDLTQSLEGLAHVIQTWKDGKPCKPGPGAQ